MKQIVTSMTQRGQVSVPVEVQRLLGLRPRDKVAFVIEDNVVRLVSAREALEAVFGSVKPLSGSNASDFDQQVRLAKEERAERTVKELRGE